MAAVPARTAAIAAPSVTATEFTDSIDVYAVPISAYPSDDQAHVFRRFWSSVVAVLISFPYLCCTKTGGASVKSRQKQTFTCPCVRLSASFAVQ